MKTDLQENRDFLITLPKTVHILNYFLLPIFNMKLNKIINTKSFELTNDNEKINNIAKIIVKINSLMSNDNTNSTFVIRYPHNKGLIYERTIKNF